MEVFRLVVSIVLLLFSGGLAFTNAGVLIRYYAQEKTGSMIPLIGGIMGVVGIVVHPNPSLHIFWWTPIVIDSGTGLWICWAFMKLVRKK